MKRLFFTIAATALLISGVVSAATLSSEIKSIDAKLRTITLTDGKVYQLAKDIPADNLKVGDKISINYDQTGTKSVISKIEKVK